MQSAENRKETKLLPVGMMGAVAAAIAIPVVISLAILVYSGEMVAYASAGIGAFLFGGMIANFVIGWLSSARGILAGPQDNPAAILAIMVASVSASMVAPSSEERFATVFVLIALTTIITGIFFILIGKFHLSNFIRFIPYPVVGGFVAGTGLLLTLGAFNVMTDLSLSLKNLGIFFQADTLPHWIFGAIFGVSLVIATRRSRKVWLVPAILILAMVIFYGYVALTGQSLTELHQVGLLLGPFDQTALWNPLTPAIFSSVNWALLVGQIPSLLGMIIVSTLALLLTSSALELIVNEDVDLEQELVASGIANIIGGLGGGPISYSYLSFSALPIRAGSKSRLNGLFAGLMYLGVLIFGEALLERTPKFIVGGFLLFLGLSFLLEWVYDAWKTLPRSDYFLVLMIIVVIGVVGFLEGIAIGILIAVILFAVNYSRLDYVKNTLTGKNYRSAIARPSEHRHLILKKGDSINILRLQGFLFFGTAQSLLNRIRERINDSELLKLEYLLLDFHRVTALDSSAVISFVRLQQLTESQNIHLLFTGLKTDIEKKLAQHNLLKGSKVHTFKSLDYGMEWCENRILIADDEVTLSFSTSLNSRLRQIFGNNTEAQRFRDYLEAMELEKGQILIQQGDSPDSLYFVDKGELIARLETEPGEFIRLSSMGGGAVVGEVGVYLGQKRTASVIASQPSIVYRLRENMLNKIEEEAPELVARLHYWNARQLSERLADNNRTIEALLD